MTSTIPGRLVERDYSKWGSRVRTWASLRVFAESGEWGEGVHSISLVDGNVLDVYLSSAVNAKSVGRTLPVFFSGALTNREGTKPPYFSGATLGSQLGVPYMAISDPTLNLSEDLGLAWYAGYEGGRVQDSIRELLELLSDRAAMHLLLIGGSGGGFASMYYASRLGSKASAFVWNPQTSITDYVPSSVHGFLKVALPNHKASPRAKDDVSNLSDAGITSKNVDFRGHRLLYLQNYNDWHVKSHLAPYLDSSGLSYRGNGLYSNSSNQSVVISAFGEGHAVPEKALIASVIGEMLDPQRSVRVVYNNLIEHGILPSNFNRLPLDLREVWRDAVPVTLTVRANPAGSRIEVELNNLVEGFGGVTAVVALYKDGVRVALSTIASATFRVFEWVEFDTVKADLFDGFGHPVGSLSTRPGASPVSVCPDAKTPRVFIYGSCISRDAFYGADGPELVDYVSRSAMGSAFSVPPGNIPTVDVSLNPSAFQRRMVTYDHEKSLAHLLEEASFDILLVDFIDERLPLVRINGSYITYSPELQRCGFTPESDDLVLVGSDEYYGLFKKGFEMLLQSVAADRIYVSRAYWASTDDRGNALGGRLVEFHNEVLDHLYDIAASYRGVRFIEYSKDHVIGDSLHKWGPSPFHYVSDFYDQTRRVLQGK
ncbi:DUF6270 domain-containing protein [Arthrobacter sp. YD2]|uniref:DUF6270 domain-containing protein n=1 Tax=Arthrobacter sp. YD2 TaxID=3058046 RepID=UPI0025B2ECCA|nr:DUF6270 domain-containing protein [Arthrobacter sp. YD2]MDN3904180.1 DUF6270 domain-containing protein [Arthrobacter sp. YD2]